MKYRKRPVVIEAVQFTPATRRAVAEFVGDAGRYNLEDGTFRIQTLEGEMTASWGDWIIRGVRGEFYPCKADIFAATYSEVVEYDAPVTETKP